MLGFVCPSCQTPLNQNELVCHTCGRVLVGKGSTSLSAVASLCRQCGNPVRPGASFCNHCGTNLNASAPGFIERQLHPGDTLAHGAYTIVRGLSKGGMGAIYLATDHATFNRQVVIKALLDYFDETNPSEVAAAEQRFLDEARMLSELEHPNIPRIYAHVQDGGYNYIVMEYIRGEDLLHGLSWVDETTGQVVPGKPYALEQVRQWGITICRVLEYLASRQPLPVIHHDIKPANLILDQNIQDVHLVDFGTARARFQRPATNNVGLQESSIYGTQGYAPPEQYQGQSTTRSDVYALAATLYHLATDDDPGEHPFQFPKLHSLGSLGAILNDALRKDPRDRPDAAELRQRFERPILNQASIAMNTASPPNYLRAPDYEHLSNKRELIDWCLQNWSMAAEWLFDPKDDLLTQIRQNWRNVDLADQIQVGLVHGDPDGSLNHLLMMLGADSQTQVQVQITVQPDILDLGVLQTAMGQRPIGLLIRNDGPQNIALRVNTPEWLTAKRLIILRAGETQQLDLSLSGQKLQELVGEQGGAHGKVEFSINGHVLLTVPCRIYLQLLDQSNQQLSMGMGESLRQTTMQPGQLSTMQTQAIVYFSLIIGLVAGLAMWSTSIGWLVGITALAVLLTAQSKRGS